MQAILWPLITWIFRTGTIKAVVMMAVVGVLAVVMELAVTIITPFANGSWLSGVFNGISPGVWYMIDFFALDIGFPAYIVAHVARFLIRRLPVIG